MNTALSELALSDLTLPTASPLPIDVSVSRPVAVPRMSAPVQAILPGVCLSALPVGTAGRIATVTLEGTLGDRLVELGFTAGAPIRLLRKAPFGGPLQVQIRDFVLSLRRADASCIHVAAGQA